MTILITGFPLNDLATQGNSVDPKMSVAQTNSAQNSVTNSKQQKNIATIDPDGLGISLDQIYLDSKSKFPIFRYKANLLIDYITATRINAFKLNVYVTEQGGNFGLGNALLNNKITTANGESRTPEDMTTAILLQASSRIDFVEVERTRNIILKYTFDLSSNLKKETLNTIRYAVGTSNFFNETLSPIIETRQEIKNYLAGDLKSNNIAPFNAATNALLGSNPSLEQLRTADAMLEDKTREIMSVLQLELLKDPSKAIMFGNSYIGLYSGLSGQSSRNLPKIDELKSIAGLDSVRAGLLNLTNNTATSNHIINDNDIISLPIVKTYAYQHLSQDIDVPVAAIGSQDFSLCFEIVDVQGRVVQLFNTNVRHSFYSKVCQIPSIPPSILSHPRCTIGKNFLDIKQMDPNGAFVKIYKRNISLNFITTDADYILIGTIPAAFGTDYIRFLDPTISGTSPSFYRVTSANFDLVESSTYGSAVSQTSKTVIAKKSGVTNKKRAVNISSVVDRTSDNRVVLFVKDIPPGVISIDLTKKDISNPQKSVEYVEKNRLIPTVNTSAIISFVDANVVSGRVYDYRVAMLYKDGTYKTAKSNHIVDYKQVTKNIISTTLSKQIVESTNGNNYNIKFSIERELNKSDPDLIKVYLEQQGLSKLYAEEMLADKSNLMQLFGSEVYRTNKNTSEVVYYGFLPTGEFTDTTIGTGLGIPPPQAGNTYEYKVITYGRNTDTIFPDKVITKTNESTGKSFSYKPSKYLNPITLSDGNLVSPNSLKRNHSASTFSMGDVLDIDFITLSIPETTTEIISARCTSVTHNKLILEWTLKGNTRKIDYYAIILQIGKIKSIIGRAHSLANTENLTYVHSYSQDVKGAVSFDIIPIFFDGSKGKPFSTKRIII